MATNKDAHQPSNIVLLDEGLSSEDVDFYKHFFNRHQLALYKFVRRLGVAEDVARDTVQDVYLRLVRQNEPAKLAKSPRGYLYRIAINLLRDNLRRTRLHADAIATSAVTDELAVVDTPEHLLLEKERIAALKEAVHRLEPDERQILLLHRLHNMTSHEIAAELRISRRTVERRLADALAFCRSHIWKAG